MKVQGYFHPPNRTPFGKSLRISRFQDVARKTCREGAGNRSNKRWVGRQRFLEIFGYDTNPKLWVSMAIFGLGPSSIDKVQDPWIRKSSVYLSQPNKNIWKVKNWQLPPAKRAWDFWENSGRWTSCFSLEYIGWDHPPPKKKRERKQEIRLKLGILIGEYHKHLKKYRPRAGCSTMFNYLKWKEINLSMMVKSKSWLVKHGSLISWGRIQISQKWHTFFHIVSWFIIRSVNHLLRRKINPQVRSPPDWGESFEADVKLICL